MNLAVLKKTRKSPEVGDVFVMQPPDGLFLYGRVIATDARIGPMHNCILIYVYRPRSEQKEAVPDLLRGQFLVPPMMTNKRPWTMGYFETLQNRELGPMDRLPQHCFLDTFGRYFDEYSNRLSGPVEPVAQKGLHSFRTIDDEISGALGIPLAPDVVSKQA
ncbi:MAG TPA: Imm26 family immunity protein [Sulfuriferula sp.]|nr:Imm26 family immunity protein [Sulfuriferula sp.]